MEGEGTYLHISIRDLFSHDLRQLRSVRWVQHIRKVSRFESRTITGNPVEFFHVSPGEFRCSILKWVTIGQFKITAFILIFPFHSALCSIWSSNIEIYCRPSLRFVTVVRVEWSAFLLRIREVLGFSLGSDTGYLVLIYLAFCDQ